MYKILHKYNFTLKIIHFIDDNSEDYNNETQELII